LNYLLTKGYINWTMCWLHHFSWSSTRGTVCSKQRKRLCCCGRNCFTVSQEKSVNEFVHLINNLINQSHKNIQSTD